MGSIPREHTYWQYMYNLNSMLLWIKASAKCINVNVLNGMERQPSPYKWLMKVCVTPCDYYANTLLLIFLQYSICSSQHLKWIKTFHQSCPKTKHVLVLGQLWLTLLIHFKCWQLQYSLYNKHTMQIFRFCSVHDFTSHFLYNKLTRK